MPRHIEKINTTYRRVVPKDKYNKLRAFAIMLVTDDEKVFYATDYDKPYMSIGHHIWQLMQGAYWQNGKKRYAKYYGKL